MLDLYTAIWRVSGGRQIILIFLSLAIAALAAVPLSYQKDIVNALTNGGLGALELWRMGAEMIGVILLSLLLKWIMSYRSGILGEDIIRLLRNRLYALSAERFRESGEAVPKGTLSTAVSAEAEELGKFTGGAFSDPVVQIGTLIAVIGYIASTQPFLGAIALAMILPQVVLVLFTQRKVNQFVAERVRVLRRATNQIVRGPTDLIDQTVLEDFDTIFGLRSNMFLWKLSTKFVVSILNGVATVGVLMLGGWLVLQGRTDVGTVVAATIGLGRIQAPTAFLIAFYRQLSATHVKFELMRELMHAPGSGPSGTNAARQT